MGAFLYATVPVAYDIVLSLDSPDQQVEKFYDYLDHKLEKHFIFEGTECEKREIKRTGFHRTFHEQCISFRMRDSSLLELKSMLPTFWKELAKTAHCEKSELNNFLDNEFDKLSFSYESLRTIDNTLASIYSNYYLRFWKSITKLYVYHGWPFASFEPNRVFVSLFTIANCDEKLGIEPNVEHSQHEAIKKVKNELRKDYEVADLIFMMGF